MSDLNYGLVSFPFSDGDSLNSFDVWSLVYNAPGSVDSLMIVDGQLDEFNMAAGTKIPNYKTQRGSSALGWVVAGTANFDVFTKAWFGDYDTSVPWDPTSSIIESAQYVPGACWSGYIPWDARALVMWTVYWLADNNLDLRTVQVFLEVDGTPVVAQMRSSGKVVEQGLTNQYGHHGYRAARLWCGHAFVGLSNGYHNIGIRVISDCKDNGWLEKAGSNTNSPNQVRFWSRHLIVVPFKYPGG